METLNTDVAVIGAGPIGIELAVGLQRAGVDYLHFDAKQIAHTVSWFAPQTRFFSSNERIAIAGVPLQTADQTKCTREQYLMYLRTIVLQFDLRIRTYEPVTSIERQEGGFVLRTDRAVCFCRRLVLATGGTAKPRRLNIPGEELPHVSHYFQDPHDYFRQRLLIIGGRNSAVEAALRSHHVGAQVAISYRGEKLDAASIKYWLFPEISGLMQSRCIAAYLQTTPLAITPSHVTLQKPDGQHFDAPADFVLLLIGYEADMSLCKLAGVELIGPGNIPRYNEQTMETNVHGIYLAGTVIGGTQERYRVFIENCHVHTERILAALTGAAPPPTPQPLERPES